MDGDEASRRARIIDVVDVSKSFEDGARTVRALDGVSLAILEGEFFTLLGPSGCGKTTLLRLIAGFEEPSAGELRLDGQSLRDRRPHQRPVNTVFQSYALFPHLTVRQNVAFGLEMRRLAPAAIERRVIEVLDMVQLGAMLERRPAQLSGGQQQRVALARALANEPRVLLLDEPLSALDLKLRREMQLELKSLQQATGITFVFVTHDQEEALTMSDRVAVMRGGRLLQIGAPAEVYELPVNRFVADFIGESNLVDVEVVDATRVRLPGGILLAVDVGEAHAPGQQATLAVRPERLRLVAPAGATLAGAVEEVVYFGTDTSYRVAIDQYTRFNVRSQNRAGAGCAYPRGARVGLRFERGAVRLLDPD